MGGDIKPFPSFNFLSTVKTVLGCDQGCGATSGILPHRPPTDATVILVMRPVDNIGHVGNDSHGF
jgi:hypothetical protein